MERTGAEDVIARAAAEACETRALTIMEAEIARRAAVRLQARWRGKKMRRMKGRLRPEEKLRLQMARYLFHHRPVEEREGALRRLEHTLQESQPTGWGTDDEPSGKDASAAPVDFGGPLPADFGSMEEDAPPEEEVKAATFLQSRIRGRLSRGSLTEAKSLLKLKDAAEHGTRPHRSIGSSVKMAACTAAVAAVGYIFPRKLMLPLAIGAVGTLSAGVAAYGVLRLPWILGHAVTALVTHFCLNGYPLGLSNLRISPWLSYEPTTLHLDAHADDFYYANPERAQCRHPHYIAIERISFVFSLKLDFLSRWWQGHGQGLPLEEKVDLHFHSIDLTNVLVNLMMGEHGEMNVAALGKELSENELKAELGGKIIHPFRQITLPNVLRLRIGAARKLLDLPNLKPRIEVMIRRTKLTTLPATRTDAPDGSGAVYHFDQEIILPVPEYDALLVVKVYSDKNKLLGQWFMTIKYLLMFPTYCKHAKCKVTGPGSIGGTFLLTDAKLHGSACRAIGCNDVGRGFSGELDMALHWTHVSTVNPLPPKPLTALEQMTQNSYEDDLKMGNKEELREYMESLPMRINVERIDAHGLTVDLADLFNGLKMEGEVVDLSDAKQRVHIKHVRYDPFVNVTFLGFLDTFVKQSINIVTAKPGALLSATDRVIGGMLTSMSRTFKRVFTGAKAAAPKVQARGEATKAVKLSGIALSKTGSLVKTSVTSTSGLLGAGGRIVGDAVGTAVLSPVGMVGGGITRGLSKGFSSVSTGVSGVFGALGSGEDSAGPLDATQVTTPSHGEGALLAADDDTVTPKKKVLSPIPFAPGYKE